MPHLGKRNIIYKRGYVFLTKMVLKSWPWSYWRTWSLSVDPLDPTVFIPVWLCNCCKSFGGKQEVHKWSVSYETKEPYRPFMNHPFLNNPCETIRICSEWVNSWTFLGQIEAYVYHAWEIQMLYIYIHRLLGVIQNSIPNWMTMVGWKLDKKKTTAY